MSMKASESKRQGCGKWLTTKSKSKKVITQHARYHQQHLKPGAVRPTCITPNVCENQSRKMKQSTMSQFLEERPIKLKLKKDKKSSDEISLSSSKDKVPVLFLKNEIPSAPIEYVLEDLFGSDADESDIFLSEDKIQKTTVDKEQNAFEPLPALYCRNSQIKELRSTDKHHSPVKEHTNLNHKAKNINSTKSVDVQFTEWFEDEVDAFIHQCDEENNLPNQENLSMLCGCTFSPQFSKWFDEQIIKMDKSPAVNILQSPIRTIWDESDNKSTFTQWFEANVEKNKSPS
ncbi:uncharacterized protein LOC114525871 [Dendronephthya gigantea]|uniref:uncharacterized protein LOC114525871 n=1 Tax=Dendronephthya gigantea TaxID=151771 RepID=UPI00106C3397|nr:uncharacterized protein LOC114525871 [Dendronephthya gigantea]